jgi:hypothetical protein
MLNSEDQRFSSVLGNFKYLDLTINAHQFLQRKTSLNSNDALARAPHDVMNASHHASCRCIDHYSDPFLSFCTPTKKTSTAAYAVAPKTWSREAVVVSRTTAPDKNMKNVSNKSRMLYRSGNLTCASHKNQIGPTNSKAARNRTTASVICLMVFSGT